AEKAQQAALDQAKALNADCCGQI
ncbi:peptidylprolyl isomerase, partial [Klebsiella pneumoniae]|nr:peptidylprolyl isomerase [Klebsiella pneumoniae]MBL1963857.1 peptidylprolyl isomerase [Klebsiella pneumoniae]